MKRTIAAIAAALGLAAAPVLAAENPDPAAPVQVALGQGDE